MAKVVKLEKGKWAGLGTHDPSAIPTDGSPCPLTMAEIVKKILIEALSSLSEEDIKLAGADVTVHDVPVYRSDVAELTVYHYVSFRINESAWQSPSMLELGKALATQVSERLNSQKKVSKIFAACVPEESEIVLEVEFVSI